jgi:streptogramin lyase
MDIMRLFAFRKPTEADASRFASPSKRPNVHKKRWRACLLLERLETRLTPSLSASGVNISPVEGAMFTRNVATFTDTDTTAQASDFTAQIDWGDGQTSSGTVAADASVGFMVNGAHVYAEEGSGPIQVAIHDVHGNTASAASTAFVKDSPLSATASSSINPVAGVAFTGTVASFTDADPTGMASDYTATITWGDGVTTAGTITASGSSGFDVSGTHAYTHAGIVTVSVVIRDVGGSIASINDLDQPPVIEFRVSLPGSFPHGITLGPDANLWFTELNANKVGQFNPTTLALTHEIDVPSPGIGSTSSGPALITTGPDGDLWFAEYLANKIGQLNPTMLATPKEYPIPLPNNLQTPNSFPDGITAGPDGNLWFTEAGLGKIGQINPTMPDDIRDYTVPSAPSLSVPDITGFLTHVITSGPDANAQPDSALWFTETDLHKIGRINPTRHVIQEYTVMPPSDTFRPEGITAGPDGNLWFTDDMGKVGRINPANGAIVEVSVPSSSLPFPGPRVALITTGPDGNIWFTETNAHKIGQINPTDPTLTVREFPVPTVASSDPRDGPLDITTGPDGNLWFTHSAGPIGEILLGHVVTVKPSPVLMTTPGAPVAIGTGNKFTDSATLSGGSNPTGSITFTLTDPGGMPVDTETVTVAGIGTYTTPTGFQPPAPGTYQWVASYSGDADNPAISSSPEAETATVSSSALELFVTGLYNSVLNRGPQSGEVSPWVAFLGSGGTRAQVAQAFWESAEHRALQVTQYYQNLLHRAPSPVEAAGWVKAFLDGATEQDVETAFVTSPEYSALHNTTSDFLASLYVNVLERSTLDAGGFTAWLAFLQIGVVQGEEVLARDQVALAFLHSPEFYQRMVDDDYMKLLRRAADPGSETAWISSLAAGANTLTSVAEAFLSSDEFFANP